MALWHGPNQRKRPIAKFMTAKLVESVESQEAALTVPCSAQDGGSCSREHSKTIHYVPHLLHLGMIPVRSFPSILQCNRMDSIVNGMTPVHLFLQTVRIQLDVMGCVHSFPWIHAVGWISLPMPCPPVHLAKLHHDRE